MAHVLIPPLPSGTCKWDCVPVEKRPHKHECRPSAKGKTGAGDNSGSEELMHGPGSTNAPGAGSSKEMEKMKKKADLAKEVVVVVDEEDEEVEVEEREKTKREDRLPHFAYYPANPNVAALGSGNSTHLLVKKTRAGTFSDSGSTEVVIITSTKSVRTETPPSAHPDDQFVQEAKRSSSIHSGVHRRPSRTSNRKLSPDLLANSTARSPHPTPCPMSTSISVHTSTFTSRPRSPLNNHPPQPLPASSTGSTASRTRSFYRPRPEPPPIVAHSSRPVFGAPGLLANLPAAAELAPVTYGGACAIASDPSPSLQNSGHLDLNVSIGIADNPADAHLDGETCGADDADDAVPLTFSAFAARLLRYPLPPRRVHAQLQQDSYLDLSPVSAVCSAGEGWVDWHAGQGFGVGEPMALDCDHESEDGPRTHEISAPAPVFLDSPSKKHRRTSWSTGPLMLGDIVVARPSGPRYAVRRWTRREASGDALASSFAFSTLNWYPDVALTPSQRRLSVMAAIAEARGEGVPESNGGWRSWIVRQGSSHHPAPAIKSKKEDLGTTAEEADE
ncbi:hypothetical protein EI94DRAFT_1810480 [Lactarius quietus]|nr:hypothetical protein EI94DRAFT_1810480 [Lactarius quietus]